MKNTFEQFNVGRLALPAGDRKFASLQWNEHPKFDGVALKHLVTAADTDGAFSYHLVRIEPNCSIGCHIHETQLETHEVIAGDGICATQETKLPYSAGVLSILPAGIEHAVHAGENGLLLFAKFMPALC